MPLSLKELRDTMVAKGGYNTTTPSNAHLVDLKNLLIEMYTARTVTLPTDSGSNLGGTSCATHTGNATLTTISLSDVSAKVPSTSLTCTAVVNNAACGCVGRTSSIGCDTDVAVVCSCNGRSLTDCVAYAAATWQCTCNGRSLGDCQGYTNPSCSCNGRTGGDCVGQGGGTATCTCYSRVISDCQSYSSASATCSCNNRTTVDCTSYVAASCSCQARTGIAACTCNTRCTCNSEKRFS